jgi:polyphosphate kinase
LQAAYSSLNASGIAVTVSEANFVTSIQSTPLAQRQQFISTVKANGLDYFYAQVVANLQQLATEAMNARHGGIYLQAECLIPNT